MFQRPGRFFSSSELQLYEGKLGKHEIFLQWDHPIYQLSHFHMFIDDLYVYSPPRLFLIPPGTAVAQKLIQNLEMPYLYLMQYIRNAAVIRLMTTSTFILILTYSLFPQVAGSTKLIQNLEMP